MTGNRCHSISIASYTPPTQPKSSTPIPGTLFHLCHTGALHRQDLAVGPVKPSGEHEIWAHELKQRAASVKLEHEEYGDLDLTKYKKVKMRKGYEREFLYGGYFLFAEQVTGLYRSEAFLDFNASGPSIVDVVDLAPMAFQRASVAIEKPMTLYVRFKHWQDFMLTGSLMPDTI